MILRPLPLLLASALLLAPLGVLSHPNHEHPKRTVRLGLLLPLTGAAASEGEGMLRGAVLAAEEINRRGGVRVGKKRMKIELVVRDDQTTPEGSIQAASQLVNNDRVDVLAGGLASASSLASQPVIAESKTPYLINGISDPAATRRTDIDTSYFFHYNEVGSFEGDRLARYLVEVVRPRVAPDRNLRVAVLYQDTRFGQDVALGSLEGHGLTAYAVAQGLPLEFVAVLGYPIGSTDHRTHLAQVKDAGPDVIVPIGYELETVAMMQQGKNELGITALWGPAAKAVETPTYYTSLGSTGDYSTILTYFSTWDSPQGSTRKKLEKFRRAYQARWNGPAGLRGANQYDSVYIFKAAIERAGSLNSKRVRNALAHLNIPELTLPLVGKRVRFDQFHEVHFDMFVTQLYTEEASGELKARIVWPDNLATAQFQLPPG